MPRCQLVTHGSHMCGMGLSYQGLSYQYVCVAGPVCYVGRTEEQRNGKCAERAAWASHLIVWLAKTGEQGCTRVEQR